MIREIVTIASARPPGGGGHSKPRRTPARPVGRKGQRSVTMRECAKARICLMYRFATTVSREPCEAGCVIASGRALRLPAVPRGSPRCESVTHCDCGFAAGRAAYVAARLKRPRRSCADRDSLGRNARESLGSAQLRRDAEHSKFFIKNSLNVARTGRKPLGGVERSGRRSGRPGAAFRGGRRLRLPGCPFLQGPADAEVTSQRPQKVT